MRRITETLASGRIALAAYRLKPHGKTMDCTGASSAILSPQENIRAKKMQPQRLAAFIRCRTIVHAIRRHFLSADNLDELVINAHGKPACPALPWLHFSIAHSADRAVVAFSAHRQVGIDIERVRRIPHMAEIHNRWLADEGDFNNAQATFFRHWTRAEATAKLFGVPLLQHMRAHGKIHFSSWFWKPSVHDRAATIIDFSSFLDQPTFCLTVAIATDC